MLGHGAATANSDEGNNNGGGGLIGMLVMAAVKQIANSLHGQEPTILPVSRAIVCCVRGGADGACVYGPRSPKYGTD